MNKCIILFLTCVCITTTTQVMSMHKQGGMFLVERTQGPVGYYTGNYPGRFSYQIMHITPALRAREEEKLLQMLFSELQPSHYKQARSTNNSIEHHFINEQDTFSAEITPLTGNDKSFIVTIKQLN